MYKRKAQILFIDQGNNGLSLMAQGLANLLGADAIEAKSTCISSTPTPPQAITIMALINIDISDYRLYSLNKKLLSWSDTVITLDTFAHEYIHEHYPTMPSGTQLIHWSIYDSTANSTSRITDGSGCRDQIKSQIIGLLGGLKMLSRVSSQ